MASTGKKFRFVKCPDCSKKLIEYASVPVYTCSGCGKVLRAKNQNDAEESSNSLLNEIDSTLDQSDICSADTVSVSSGERIALYSSNVTEESGSGMNQFAFRSRRTRTCNQEDESFQANISHSMNKQVESSPKLTEQGNIVPNSNDELYETSSSFSHSIASDEDMLDRARGTIFYESSRSSTSRSSHAYYGGSISSSDGGSSTHAHGQHHLNSRRTFRQRIVDDKKEKKGDLSENESMTTERYYSATVQNSDIIRDEFSSIHGVSKQLRGTSLDSEDFQFLSNSIESEIGRSSRSSSRDSTFDLSNQVSSKLLEHDRTERQRKMNKLREQLSRSTTDQSWDEKAHRRRGSDHLQQFFAHKPNQQQDPCLRSNSTSTYTYGTRYRETRNVTVHNQQTQLPSLPPSSCSHHHMEDQRLQLLPNCGNGRSCGGPAWSLQSRSSTIHTHIPERECQPISGGAPFIICNYCFNLLQVPLDAIISRRRSSKLRCGTCSKVIMLSFPASKTISASHSETYHQGGPVSISEVYEPSYSESY
ncbi:uncharacterized protein [Typha angustifolia]|uniref:uncharacterized protein n=1 Tax=Typha angustifolia TaxID=59011 RepID=UPI003C2C1795